jgi:hypothetical protein
MGYLLFIEYILVSLVLNGVLILVGSVYSPDRRHIPEMEEFLAELDYDHLIVLGMTSTSIRAQHNETIY